jgi:hypothetical protein
MPPQAKTRKKLGSETSLIVVASHTVGRHVVGLPAASEARLDGGRPWCACQAHPAAAPGAQCTQITPISRFFEGFPSFVFGAQPIPPFMPPPNDEGMGGGLNNFGNTCFLNAFLQLLRASPEIRAAAAAASPQPNSLRSLLLELFDAQERPPAFLWPRLPLATCTARRTRAQRRSGS